MTALHIYSVKKQAASLRTGDSQIHNKDREKYFLYLRLFIVMGVSWVMESFSWIFTDAAFLFLLTDFLNALQGFFIFFLFVWRPKVKALIMQK
jgi:G protein-coupled receptor Mth (Methuselah protein)